MEPTLREGDRLLLLHGRRPVPGRVVVVRLPSRPGHPDRPVAVKRLVRADPQGWWVERDNPREGVDSWTVGVIPDRDLLAVAVARLWPRPRLLRASS